MMMSTYGNRPSGFPTAPPWARSRLSDNDIPSGNPLDPPASRELPPISPEAAKASWGNGYSPDDMLKMFPPVTETIAPTDDRRLPKPPPSVMRSDNPFAKDNLSRTLLDIGAAFLSNDDFGHGLGAAAQAVGGRQDALRAANQKQTTYGGPGGQFEITQAPDGTRSVREVPEFADAIRREAEAKKALGPKETVDLRSRLVHSISQLPPEQRAAAYRDLMANPEYYGVDTKGMPTIWNDNYGAVMGDLGQTVNQAEAGVLRGQQFQHRQAVDQARLQQGDQRLQQGATRLKQGGGRSGPRATSKAPSGFIWDN